MSVRLRVVPRSTIPEEKCETTRSLDVSYNVT